MSRAAYMREYRARRTRAAYDLGRIRATDGELAVADIAIDALSATSLGEDWAAIAQHLGAENVRLTEEVHRLKRALAQASRDAILRKVNRHD